MVLEFAGESRPSQVTVRDSRPRWNSAVSSSQRLHGMPEREGNRAIHQHHRRKPSFHCNFIGAACLGTPLAGGRYDHLRHPRWNNTILTLGCSYSGEPDFVWVPPRSTTEWKLRSWPR